MNIQDSLDEIIATKTAFAESFYGRLKQEHPQVFRHFDGVEMRHQAHHLTMALILIVKEYAKPNEAVKFYLRLLGTRHSRKSIERSAYKLWAETMISTLADFHAEHWHPELADEWREAIAVATEQMFIGYDEPQHV